MLLLFLGFIIVFTTTIGEHCRTPTGQLGRCIHLTKCPYLLWSFANPKSGMVDNLKKFKCANNYDNAILVCCRDATDILVFEDEENTLELNSINNIKQLVNVNSCGIHSSLQRENQIVHLKNFPWLVKIMITNRDHTYSKIRCTGVLINERYVLFSAQCYSTALDWESYYYVRIDYYTGNGSKCKTSHSSYTTVCSTAEVHKFEDFLVHPFYDPVTKFNDLALIRLSNRIQFSEFVYPICFPLVEETFTNNVMLTSGWNDSFFESNINVKTIGTSTSITNSACTHLNKGSDVLTNFDLCTVNNTGHIDVGYPLMSFYKDRWYIIGFTSRGKEPRIHTKVQNYLQWIEQTVINFRTLPYAIK
ncbi:hypothetical protein FQR65_LT10129 [Abscondita terminalis]|nr:hypothetical protein FQR65_LT10129 [Abscondita terminalis]